MFDDGLERFILDNRHEKQRAQQIADARIRVEEELRFQHGHGECCQCRNPVKRHDPDDPAPHEFPRADRLSNRRNPHDKAADDEEYIDARRPDLEVQAVCFAHMEAKDGDRRDGAQILDALDIVAGFQDGASCDWTTIADALMADLAIECVERPDTHAKWLGVRQIWLVATISIKMDDFPPFRVRNRDI